MAMDFVVMVKGKSMKVEIEIPKEFVKHFLSDRFKDSLLRLSTDANLIAGLYEQELAEMLIKAFQEAKVNENIHSDEHGYWIQDYIGRHFCSICGNMVNQDEIEEFGHNKICPSCGAKMDRKDKINNVL